MLYLLFLLYYTTSRKHLANVLLEGGFKEGASNFLVHSVEWIFYDILDEYFSVNMTQARRHVRVGRRRHLKRRVEHEPVPRRRVKSMQHERRRRKALDVILPRIGRRELLREFFESKQKTKHKLRIFFWTVRQRIVRPMPFPRKQASAFFIENIKIVHLRCRRSS